MTEAPSNAADREARRAALLARYGTADSALSPCRRERDLSHALWRLIVPGTPETGGSSLVGWRGPEDGPLPPDVHSAVVAAIGSLTTAAAAWEEAHHWTERAEVHSLLDGPGLPLWVRARRAFLEVRLDTLFAVLTANPDAVAAWNRLAKGGPAAAELEPPPSADPVPTATPEPEPAHMDEAGDSSSHGGGPSDEDARARSAPSPASGNDTNPVETDQPKRTRAEKQAAVRALLGEPLTDREIARRVGVSPSTIAAVRKAAQHGSLLP